MIKKVSEVKREWLEVQLKELSLQGITKAEAARKLDILPQYLNSIMNGNRGITDSFLDKFIATFNINHFDLFFSHSPSCLSCKEKERYISSLQEIINSKNDAIKTKNILINQLIENEEL